MTWTCKACKLNNWQSRATCRACDAKEAKESKAPAHANSRRGKGRARSTSKKPDRSSTPAREEGDSRERGAMKTLEQIHGPEWQPCKAYRERQIEQARDRRREGSPETRLKKSREFIDRKNKELDKQTTIKDRATEAIDHIEAAIKGAKEEQEEARQELGITATDREMEDDSDKKSWSFWPPRSCSSSQDGWNRWHKDEGAEAATRAANFDAKANSYSAGAELEALRKEMEQAAQTRDEKMHQEMQTFQDTLGRQIAQEMQKMQRAVSTMMPQQQPAAPTGHVPTQAVPGEGAKVEEAPEDLENSQRAEAVTPTAQRGQEAAAGGGAEARKASRSKSPRRQEAPKAAPRSTSRVPLVGPRTATHAEGFHASGKVRQGA